MHISCVRNCYCCRHVVSNCYQTRTHMITFNCAIYSNCYCCRHVVSNCYRCRHVVSNCYRCRHVVFGVREVSVSDTKTIPTHVITFNYDIFSICYCCRRVWRPCTPMLHNLYSISVSMCV